MGGMGISRCWLTGALYLASQVGCLAQGPSSNPDWSLEATKADLGKHYDPTKITVDSGGVYQPKTGHGASQLSAMRKWKRLKAGAQISTLGIGPAAAFQLSEIAGFSIGGSLLWDYKKDFNPGITFSIELY